MKKVRLILLIQLMIMLSFILPLPAQAALTMRTDQPLYTPRDAQVTLLGSGFPNQPNYVWVKGPNDNHTTYTGITFSPDAGGLIPASVSLPITAQGILSALGTYTVSISTSSTYDSSQSVVHFGMWGTVKPLYQRTETAKIMGGGLFPGASLKMSIRNPAGNYIVTATIAAASNGNFNYSYRIPVDAVTESYKILIDGTGTFDNAQQDYVSMARFSVTPATLTPKFGSQPGKSYQRTETAKASVVLSYPDGSPVVSLVPNTRPAILMQNQSTVGFATLALADQPNGIWSASQRLPVNATASSGYRFVLSAMSFDDGFGNKGGAKDVYSDYFQVKNASLTIVSSINGTQIQIPFGQVSIISKIVYPDGTALTNGTVSVAVSSGSSITPLSLSYDLNLNAWHGSYSSSFNDIWRIGTWTLKVQARDNYGNSGVTSYGVSAQPYLVVGLIICLLLLVLYGRWAYTRYGRKLYFRIRKWTQRFKRSNGNL